MNLLLIAIGGAVGAVLRYLTMSTVTRVMGIHFPYGTLCANIVGSLCMGLLIGWLARTDAPLGFVNTQWHVLVAVGMLGSYTTFSTFSLDTVTLVQRGAWLEAGGYMISSVVLSVGAVLLGLQLMRWSH